MRKRLNYWQIGGFVFTGIVGTLLHFAYNWSNQSVFFAPFSAINESIGEHMKLLFFPMFVFALTENIFLGNEYENFWYVKFLGITLGILLIPILYYSYTGIFGIEKDWINISIFFLANAVTYLLETWLLKRELPICAHPLLALFLLCLIAFVFVVFTFVPPEIPLFEPPN